MEERVVVSVAVIAFGMTSLPVYHAFASSTRISAALSRELIETLFDGFLVEPRFAGELSETVLRVFCFD